MNRPSASRDTGRGDRRAPQLREVQDEERRALGEELRAARLQRGDDLAAVAAKLRIRTDHLQAIEDGRFDDLPGKTYAIGFLRSYAGHLGLDPNAVLTRYRQETRSDLSSGTLYFPEPIKEARRPRAWLVALALILLGGVYAAWYYGSAERRVAQEVWPLPDRTSETARTSGTETAASSFDTAPAGATQDAQTDSGFVTAATQPPQTGYPETTAPTEGSPAALGEQGAPTTHGDTAVAAIGPRDWRSEPANAPAPGDAAQPNAVQSNMAASQPGEANQTMAAADPSGIDPASGASRGSGLDANGTWTAPQAQADRSHSPEFGNLIAATRGEKAASQSQDRVAALPPDGTSAATNPAPADLAAEARGAPRGNADSPQQTIASLHPVTLHARGATWIQLRGQDGSVLVSRIFQPGESYQVPDETGLMLTTGNAGGLDIEVDGSHTGPIGPVGAVRRHISIDRLRADAR